MDLTKELETVEQEILQTAQQKALLTLKSHELLGKKQLLTELIEKQMAKKTKKV